MRVRENALCESCCANPRLRRFLRRRPSTYDDSRAHSRRVDHADMDRCDVRTSPVCPLIPFPRPVSKVIPKHEAAEPHGELFVCAETTVGARFVVSISLARDSLARDSLCRSHWREIRWREIRCVGCPDREIACRFARFVVSDQHSRARPIPQLGAFIQSCSTPRSEARPPSHAARRARRFPHRASLEPPRP